MSNYNTTLQSNNTDLQAILNTINELPNAGGSEPLLQDKTITPTASVQTVKADSNYDGLDTVTVNAMPTATQATPSISVNSSGLITATATQSEGYVTAGSKSSTHQLAFQAAKTITPTTTSQVAVSSGYYTGGNITVAAIPSTYIQPSGALTISSNGTYNVTNYASAEVNVASSGGGNTDMEDGLVTKTLTEYSNDRVTTIGSYTFYRCTSLKTVSFPNCTTIGSYAFYSCTSLTTVSFPNCTSIGYDAFYSCTSLTTVSFPNCTTIDSIAFSNCTSLTTVSFPNCTTIGNSAFMRCTSLTTVSFPNCTTIGNYAFAYGKLSKIYLTASSLCTLDNSNAFYSTSIKSTTGSIYVPTSLVSSYKKATNWTYFSNRIYGV